MIKKANINWTVKQLCKMMEKGSIRFDNAVQRGYCWDKERKVLLIHSLIEGYPIPAFFAAKTDNFFDMLDGKQRSNAMYEFINGKFALPFGDEVEGEDGLVSVSEMSFENLPEEFKDAILSYSLTIYYFDQITENEVNELFYRLNNGKALSSFDSMRAKIKCHNKIKDLSNHEIFTSVLTEKALAANKAEELAMKAWATLYMTFPSYERKELEPEITIADITDEQVFTIKDAFIRLQNVYKLMKEYQTVDYARSAKRMMVKTHFLSLIPLTLRSKRDGILVEDFMEWVQKFFSGKKYASISEAYNRASGNGSAKSDNIKIRLNEMTADYEKYFKNKIKNEPIIDLTIEAEAV